MPRGIFTDWQSRRLRRAEGADRTSREMHKTRLAYTSLSEDSHCSTRVICEKILDRHRHINERYASRRFLFFARKTFERAAGEQQPTERLRTD